MIDTRIHDVVGHLIPFTPNSPGIALRDTPRWRMYYYINRCELVGFCKTPDDMIACAKRWLAGKRRVTPPGFERRKKEAKQRAKAMQSIPPELKQIVSEVIAACPTTIDPAKRINYCVGQVLKRFKFDPVIVRELILGVL